MTYIVAKQLSCGTKKTSSGSLQCRSGNKLDNIVHLRKQIIEEIGSFSGISTSLAFSISNYTTAMSARAAMRTMRTMQTMRACNQAVRMAQRRL